MKQISYRPGFDISRGKEVGIRVQIEMEAAPSHSKWTQVGLFFFIFVCLIAYVVRKFIFTFIGNNI